MSGNVKGLVTLAQKRIQILFLHRAMITSKSLVPKLQNVLDDNTIRIINYIRSRPLQLRLFAEWCSLMDASQVLEFLLSMEVRQLSRGRVLLRFYELKVASTILKMQHSKLAGVTRFSVISCISWKVISVFECPHTTSARWAMPHRYWGNSTRASKTKWNETPTSYGRAR